VRLLRFLTLTVALGLACERAFGASPAPVALLPFENLSTDADAAAEVSLLVASALRAKGWTVVGGDAVETALDSARVRYLDSIATDVRPKLAAATGAPVLALGAIYAYDATADPRVSIGLRLISADSRVLFSEVVAMRAEDAERVFEFDRARTRDELAKIAVARLLRAVPRPGALPVSLKSRRVPVHLSAPRTFRSAALAAGTRHRIAVLPFANAGPHEAARIISELVARRLSASTLFDTVEPADLRDAFVSEKIRDLSDPSELRRLGKRLGTTLFLTGSIYEFAEPAQAGSGSPRLEMEATLTDVATGEVVWTSYASRRGTDYRGLLDLGAITSIVGLADQSIAEMIHAAEKASPISGPRAGREALTRSGRKEIQ